MPVDRGSNQQQILQGVLDETEQALKVVPVTSPAAPSYVTTTGKPAFQKMTHDYQATPVTTTPVSLTAATTAATTEMEIFDSSGQLMIITAGTETVYVFPGGNGRIPWAIAAGTAITVKASSTTADAGFIAINLYGE